MRERKITTHRSVAIFHPFLTSFYLSYRRRKEVFFSALFSALRNPGTFYWSLTTPKDWTVPQNADLWQDERKTLFDPCPAGWRVPRGGVSGSVESPWHSFATDALEYANGNWSADDFCGRWPVNGGVAWYPVPGARYSASAFVNTAVAGHNWSTTIDDDHRVFYFRLDATRVMSGLPESNRAFGFSVRCIRE